MPASIKRQSKRDARGRRWSVALIPVQLAAEEDARFWFEDLSPEERVTAVNDCLESALLARSRRVPGDCEELLESFNDAGVRYLIGGAHALALHARPRATEDLDVFIAPTQANARRLLVALGRFFGGSPPSYVTMEAVLDLDTIMQLGVAPVRVDISSAFASLTFREAWKHRCRAAFGSVPASYLILEQGTPHRREAIPRSTSRSRRRGHFGGRGSKEGSSQKGDEGQTDTRGEGEVAPRLNSS